MSYRDEEDRYGAGPDPGRYGRTGRYSARERERRRDDDRDRDDERRRQQRRGEHSRDDRRHRSGSRERRTRYESDYAGGYGSPEGAADGGYRNGGGEALYNPNGSNANGGWYGADPSLQGQPFGGAQGPDLYGGNGMQPGGMDMFAAPYAAPHMNMIPGASMMIPLGAQDGGSGSFPGMSPQALLALLQQQQQQQQNVMSAANTPHAFVSHASAPSSSSSPPPSAAASSAAGGRQLPSVEDFIPVVPVSLLNLVKSDASTAAAAGGDGGGGGSKASPASQAQAGATTGGGEGLGESAANGEAGALVLLEAPKIAPQAERYAREARRAHISGFPPFATQEELMDFFQLVMPDVRRVMTQREVQQLALAAGDDESDIRQIPVNAQTDLDEIRSLSVSMAKTKTFGFLEVSMADIITEMIEECAKDPERFMFPASDGRSYAIALRRPRDYAPLSGIDESKVVMTGFPPTLPEDKLRAAFEQFGPLDKFESKGGLAYGEFQNLKDAQDCRLDLHGEVLGTRMVIVLPLYDWLKVLCVRADIDVTMSDDDPLSGKAVIENIAAEAAAAAAAAAASAVDPLLRETQSALGGAPGALVLHPGTNRVDHMRELLEMAVSIPDTVFHLAHTYPHLRPLYGNHQVPIYPTPVLVLLNLFDEEELVLDSTYSQLVADIEEEVEKYGRVVELIVPRREARPRPPEQPKKAEEYDSPEEAAAAVAAYEAAKAAFAAAVDTYMERQLHPVWGGYGRVFVEYQTVDEAAHAQQQIAGKLFGGRTVITSFLFEDLLHSPTASEGRKEEEADGEEADGEAAESPTAEEKEAADKNSANADEENDDRASHTSTPNAEDRDSTTMAEEATVDVEDVD